MKNKISPARKHFANIVLFFAYACLYPIGLITSNCLSGADISNVGMFHIAYSSIVAQLGIGLIYLSVELYKNKEIKIFHES